MRPSHQLILAIVALTCSSASAQPAGAQAQVLFDRAIALMDAGKFDEACAAFDASDKLEAAISTLLNRADCREKNHQYATAWGLFLDAERQTRVATDAATQQLHQVAVDHAAKLEPRLSKLTVRVPAGSRIIGLQISRGTDPVEAGAWNHPLPIDGGTYTLTGHAATYDTWTTVIRVAAEHDDQYIDVPRLKLSPIIVPAKRAKLPFILGGVGVGMLAGGLVFELSAEDTYDQSKRQWIDAEQLSLWHTANTKRYVAEGLAAGGLALLGVAVWRYVRHGTVESPSQISVAPHVGSDQAGLQVLGRY